MKMRTSLEFYRTTFWSALGLSPLVACGGVASDGIAVGNGGGAGGPGTGGIGVSGAGATMPAMGGAPSTGGTRFAGGAQAGGATTSGAPGAGGVPPQTTCRNPQPFPGPNGEATGLVQCDGAYGAFHRVAKVDCPSIVPRPPMYPGSCGGAPPGGQCCQDSDCTAQPYGHCEASTRGGPGGGYFSCSYGCVRDSQCATGEICLCGPAVGRCIPASCTSDADCGGLLCITSDATFAGGFCDTYSIACQTPTDQCTTDKDCGSFVPCVAMPSGQRSCRDTGCAQGGVGRPFLIDGSSRLATALERADWSADSRTEIASLGASDRATLAARWTDIALAEHASIAANARFVLELLSLGAPGDLIQDANAAMADEAVHARDAFALASAYTGHPVGPGPLDISGVLGTSSLLEIVRRAIVEGCIGETVAAVEAAEALAFAEDESVRTALERAASDEIRHAELAWRFIQWMLVTGDARFRIDVATCFAESVHRESHSAHPTELASNSASDSLRAYGFLEPAVRQEIRRRVIVEIVEPCGRALLAVVGARSSVRRDAEAFRGKAVRASTL